MKKLTYLAAFACTLFFASCSNGTKDANMTTEANTPGTPEQAEDINEDKKLESESSDFVTNTAADGMKEVEMAKVAKAKAKNADVKKFAERMITDHSKANEELMGLAKTKQITVPVQLSDDAKKDVDDYSKKASGAEFDKDYMDMMVSEHKKAVDKFDDMSKNAKDAEIKDWAAKTLPTLRSHLEEAEKLSDKLNMKK